MAYVNTHVKQVLKLKPFKNHKNKRITQYFSKKSKIETEMEMSQKKSDMF